jgi:hypothetical protein
MLPSPRAGGLFDEVADVITDSIISHANTATRKARAGGRAPLRCSERSRREPAWSGPPSHARLVHGAQLGNATTLVAPPKSARRLSTLGALRVVDPEKWASTVRRAMRRASGRVPDAAAALDVSVRQLFRWLNDPLLADVERASSSVHRDEA